MNENPGVTLADLIAEYGLGIRYQILSRSLDGQQTTRAKDGTTRLSFRTEVSLTDVMRERTEGFVVWMDRDQMKAAMDRCIARLPLRGKGALLPPAAPKNPDVPTAFPQS